MFEDGLVLDKETKSTTREERTVIKLFISLYTVMQKGARDEFC